MERYALIENGFVVNVVVADPNDLPDEAIDWVLCGDAGIGWTYDGQVFTAPVKAPPPTEEEAFAALVEEQVAALFDATQKRDRALAEMMWQIAKATKTGNWSWFDAANGGAGVNSKADFREAFKEIVAGL